MSLPKRTAAAGDVSGDANPATSIPVHAPRRIHKAFITGASGFVGVNLVRALLDRGTAVLAYVRSGSDRSGLAGLDVEVLEGELLDRGGLARAMRSSDACFHLAAALSSDDPAELERVNVQGSLAVLEAAREAGCTAIVHATTIGTLGRTDGGMPREGDSHVPATGSAYARSKLRSEEGALELAGRGAPVILAHLAAPVGPWDRHPTVTGRRIVRVLQGKRLVYPRGAVNHVAVRDVAAGLILAAGLGRAGQRYILANSEGNLTRRQFVAQVIRSGAPPRRRRGMLGPLGAIFRRLRGSAEGGPVSLACDPSWSVKELGLPQTPLDEAFAESVAWFREHGYVS